MNGNYPHGVTAKDIPGFTDKGAPEYHICKECDTSYKSDEPLNYCFEHCTTEEELREECANLAASRDRLLAENTRLELDLAAARGELFRLRKLMDAQDAGKAVA